MIAFPARIQTAFVQFLVSFLFGTEPVDPTPDVLKRIVFRRFAQKTAFAFLHSGDYRITNLTTEQGGSTVVKPSAVVSKPENSLIETTSLLSKLLCS